jgi:uncharacterized protein YlxP (DUF503 family)
MNVGVCKIRMRLSDNHSLKGKRQVAKPIIERVKNRYNVSIAEVDDQDLWQLLTIGITCVSSSGPHANEMLSKVVDFIQQSKHDVEMLDYEIEIIHAF